MDALLANIPEWATEAQRLLLSEHRSEETKRAYQREIADFFQFTGHDTSPTSIVWLCSHDAGPLALLLNGYKATLRERRLAEATINRKLAAVRSLLRFARRLGAPCPDPQGLVASEKVRAYRDTSGPGIEAVATIIAEMNTDTVAGKRDAALLLLLIENALRRTEVCRCDVADFDPSRKRLFIIGKGRGNQKEPITLSTTTTEAIQNYLTARAASGDGIEEQTPLFVSYGRGTRAHDGRLTGNGLWRIVQRYGLRFLGESLHPHALRHTSITALLNATQGNIRMAQRLSRHKDLRTLAIYDDNREDLQGEATNLLSGLIQRAQDNSSIPAR